MSEYGRLSQKEGTGSLFPELTQPPPFARLMSVAALIHSSTLKLSSILPRKIMRAVGSEKPSDDTKLEVLPFRPRCHFSMFLKKSFYKCAWLPLLP